MERWRDRIIEAIHMGYAVDERGQRIPLDENTGVDILGNIMESSIISPNRPLEHKRRLPPYTLQQLQYDGISIDGVQVASDGGQPNICQRFGNNSDLDLSRGMDFVPRGNVFARFHTLATYAFHLHHQR
ncbi:hypothetical protein DOY81_010718 [Sarcophaga bullata]|nr:hypothetical protein DOY81_010718 [Sarcophaga bullata]